MSEEEKEQTQRYDPTQDGVLTQERELTQTYLKSILDYDPETGEFRWKWREGMSNKINSRYAGNIAGSSNGKRYIDIQIDGKVYKAHRLAWLYMEGYLPENEIDHIDRIKDNNKWGNLREVSQSCNKRNRSILSNNTSGVTGVYWSKHRCKWYAFQRKNNRKVHIGCFENFDDAVLAKYKAEIEEDYYACLNGESSAYLYLKEKGLLPEEGDE